ncbi:MAG TPA: DUF2917 domain-containing protein [Noviherbaspirillum sp.]|nr:DUF2917 domain-containing protein [Noviherbaspirillum sp.]
MQPKIVAVTRSQVECELHENRPLRLVAAEGRRIHCVSGVVWITAYGEPVDVFLRPGTSFTVPNGGLVLAEAVGTSRIRVDLPRAFDYSHYGISAFAVISRFLRGLQLRPKRTV